MIQNHGMPSGCRRP